jgi:hypothetical protein
VLHPAGVVLPSTAASPGRAQRIAAKQVDLAFIQSATPQLAAAGPPGGGHGRVAGGAHRQLRRAKAALGKSLTSSQPTGDGGCAFASTRAFDGIVAWLRRLSQQHGVRVESAEIETAGEPGMVNAGSSSRRAERTRRETRSWC